MAKKLSQGKREPITFNLSKLLYRSKKDTGDFLFLDAEKCNGCGDCCQYMRGGDLVSAERGEGEDIPSVQGTLPGVRRLLSDV